MAKQQLNTTKSEATTKEADAHEAVLAELAREKRAKEEAMKMRKEAEEEAKKMKKEAEEEAAKIRNEGEEQAEPHVNDTETEAKKKEAAAHEAVLAELAKEKKVT